MLLLSFTVRNHASIKDEATLDLTRPSLRTLKPKDGNWSSVSYPLAGIFGANATGKSALLDALNYMFTAIKSSASTWQGTKYMPRAPFALDGSDKEATSSYEIDFVHNGHRHRYGFEVDRTGIVAEWLYDVPKSRWRTLLERGRDAGLAKFHKSLGSRITPAARELVLSRALILDDSRLATIAHDLTHRFDCVLVKDAHRHARLSSIADSLAEGTITFADLEALLEVADIGVSKVKIEEERVADIFQLAFASAGTELQDANTDENTDTEGKSRSSFLSIPDEIDEELLSQVIRHLRFTHHGSAKDCPSFSVEQESNGTIAWLAAATPAIEILRSGGLLLIDEIDASLHPHLLEVLLGAFANPSVNKHHAQLIFTSHESYILSSLSEVKLEPEQVWFTDKSRMGVTELYSLADFPKHPDANVARRYLLGRYGGTPHLSPSILRALVDTTED